MLQVLMLATAALQSVYTVQVELDHPDGFYKVGAEAVCTATLLKDGQPAVNDRFRCLVKKESRLVESRVFAATGKPVTIKAGLDRPGWIYFGFEVLDAQGRPQAGPGFFKHQAKPSIAGEIGAMFEPHRIRAFPARPADFDAYWAQCRARLNAVPLAAKLAPSPVPEKLQSQLECFSIEVACLGNQPVRGYLAVPKGARPKSLPAIVEYQSLHWGDANKDIAIRRAAKHGAISLYATWHGLPTGHDRDYYEQMAKTWYKPWAGDDNRDTWFWHHVFYRVLRALDYVKSRPEWNGRDLIVSGGSAGGIQTIAAAALDPQVTLALVNVPAFSDFQGFRVGRDYGPVCYRGPAGLERMKNSPQIQTMLFYHDAVNFAPMIQCDIYVCTGFTDELCTPSSVYAFYNNLTAARIKAMTTDPRTGHYGMTKNVKGDKRLEELCNSIRAHQYPKD
jgi:cephalosporin-C deacetylase-like acetyl esterase